MRSAHAVLLLAAAAGCVPAKAPDPDQLLLAADAPGTALHPAEVRLVVSNGALRVSKPPTVGHLVAGTIHASDPTLLPHVTVNARGVAVVQDFEPEKGARPKIVWDLTLGATPMRLWVRVKASEDQRFDLGGRAIVDGRLDNEAGHMQVDWSEPNAIACDHFSISSIGYLEARHVARSRAKQIDVKSVGLAEIDVGDRVDRELRIGIEAMGTVVLTVPDDTSTTVTLAGAAARVEADGWANDAGSYVHAAPSSAQVVIVAAKVSGVVKLRTSPPQR